MDLEAYMGSNQQLQNLPDDIIQLLNSSFLFSNEASSSMGNLFHSSFQLPQQNVSLAPGDRSISLLNTATNSRSSPEESSMITVASSSYSGGSYLPTNGSSSTESLTSNHGRVLSPSTSNHFPAQQQIFQEGQSYPSWCGVGGDQLSSPSLAPQLMMTANQAPVPSLFPKKPRLETNQGDTLHANGGGGHPLYSQFPLQFNRCDMLAAARLLQMNSPQNRMQNQTPVSVPSQQRHQVPSQAQHQTPTTSQKQLAGIPTVNVSVCYRRLMFYLHDQRSRPADNNINFWTRFVDHYYSRVAKKRWCLSKYHDVACHARSMFSQTTAVSWKCDFCGSNFEKGFEATRAVLPRITQVYFGSGVNDELLYLDEPVERMLPSGYMVLWFSNATQESVYNHFRVVHEGKLRIIFNRELKIVSWDFCIQRHEELVSRLAITAQVNNLVQEAARFQNNFEGISAQDMLQNCNRISAAGNNMVTNLLPVIINDFGFPKQFVRHLQMSDTIHCMKDLMTESLANGNNSSPIALLRRYSKQASKENQKNVEASAQMQRTSSANSNFQGANMATQIPNAREHHVLSGVPIYHPNGSGVMAEQRMISNPKLSMKTASGPSSSQVMPTVGLKINELLAFMRAEGNAPRKCSKNICGGKRRLIYDPNTIDKTQVMDFADKSNGKGFNYSSSSNSSMINFADNSVVKREPESEDDSTSPAHPLVTKGKRT